MNASLKTIAPRLARLVPLLGSDKEGEAIGAAKAINRTLAAEGLDLHDLAAAIGGMGQGGVPSNPPKWISMPMAERVRWLEAVLAYPHSSAWEKQMAADHRAKILAYPCAKQTPSQVAKLDELFARVWRRAK